MVLIPKKLVPNSTPWVAWLAASSAKRRHDRQRGGVGGCRGLVLASRPPALFDTRLRQPRQVWRMCRDVLLGAGSLPRPGLHRTQQCGQFRCGGGVFGTERVPCTGGRQQRPGPGPVLSSAECTSGGAAIHSGAVIVRRAPIR